MGYNNNHVIQHAFLNMLYFWAQSRAMETFAACFVEVRVRDQSLVISICSGNRGYGQEAIERFKSL
jgi:hypothetical protein